MPGAVWPHWADDIVERARSGASGTTWERAAAIVGESGLTAEQVAFLATLGLAELAAWADRLDRDAARVCAGEVVARSRYAGMRGYLRAHTRSWDTRADRDR